MVTTTMPHVWLDEQGRAWIDDTNVKVIEVVLDHLAYVWSAEEIHRQHPDFSAAQAYAALAYYYDHKAEFDRQIEDRLRQAESMAEGSKDIPLLKKITRVRQAVSLAFYNRRPCANSYHTLINCSRR